MRKWGNGEMGKWEGTMHFTQQTEYILLLQSSKSMSIHALTERSSLPDSWDQRGMQRHCIMVCKHIQVFHFWQLVSNMHIFVSHTHYYSNSMYNSNL